MSYVWIILSKACTLLAFAVFVNQDAKKMKMNDVANAADTIHKFDIVGVDCRLEKIARATVVPATVDSVWIFAALKMMTASIFAALKMMAAAAALDTNGMTASEMSEMSFGV